MAGRGAGPLEEEVKRLTGKVARLEGKLRREREAAQDDRARALASEDVLNSAAIRLAEAHASAFEGTARLHRLTGVLNRIQQITESDPDRAGEEESPAGLLAVVAEAWEASRASLLVITPGGKGRRLRMVGSYGLPRYVRPEQMRPPLISGWVAWNQQTFVHRAGDGPSGLPLIGDRDYVGVGFVSVPLLFRRGALGVLNLTNFAGEEPGEESVMDLQIVACSLAWVVRDTLRLDPPHPRRSTGPALPPTG